MNRILEDDLVSSLFFYVTSTGRRGVNTTFVEEKQEWKHPTPVRRRLSRTHAVLGKAIPEARVLVEKVFRAVTRNDCFRIFISSIN